MKVTVKMPRVADTADSVLVTEWLCTPGDSVASGDPLMRVETDKALVEVPAPMAGVVVDLMVSVDDEISTGTPIAVLETP